MCKALKPTWLGIHHVHFYVEDAIFWRKWFEFYLDFQAIASYTDQVQTEIIQHGTIQIRLSSPRQINHGINKNHRVAKYLEHHPPGIGEVAFAIAPDSYAQTPELLPSWGDVTHRLIPTPINDRNSSGAQLFTGIDHMVINVPIGQMWSAAQWYEAEMGLVVGDRFEIQTDHSALSSVVMHSTDHKIQIPINEPSGANSQIQEFLDYNQGAGIQHLALHTNDIVKAIATLKQRGVQFLETQPDILVEYQDQLAGRALLQIFTKPIFAQPTFFLEIIQRQNQAQGFGEGNFKSLFEAIEREQMIRSN